MELICVLRGIFSVGKESVMVTEMSVSACLVSRSLGLSGYMTPTPPPQITPVGWIRGYRIVQLYRQPHRNIYSLCFGERALYITICAISLASSILRVAGGKFPLTVMGGFPFAVGVRPLCCRSDTWNSITKNSVRPPGPLRD